MAPRRFETLAFTGIFMSRTGFRILGLTDLRIQILKVHPEVSCDLNLRALCFDQLRINGPIKSSKKNLDHMTSYERDQQSTHP